LADRSRRPRRSPQTTASEITRALLEFHRRHPTWGAGKLVQRLTQRAPDRPWPAASTAHEILKRHGYRGVQRRRAPRTPTLKRPLAATAPNVVWTIDFKGEFRTGDGIWCYPLTVMDAYSRYLVACQALAHPRTRPTQRVLAQAFREYGVPHRLRSDNGSPFACTFALGRLSRLMVWCIHLGIVPERIQPGCPGQNGRHERMHRTLKRATVWPPARTRPAQQRRFNAFRTEYNDERPHSALAQLPPAAVYVPSSRTMPDRLPPIDYPAAFDRRRVSSSGCMRWKGVDVTVTTVLVGEDVGLEEIGDGIWAIFFGPLRLGTIDERRKRIDR
jgi:transposase InsO family protein